MLPERNQLIIINEQLADIDDEFDREMDNIYLDSVYQSILKGDGEDHKRIALMDFDVPAHRQLVLDLEDEGQYRTAHVIQWYLDEYARLFPNRSI